MKKLRLSIAVLVITAGLLVACEDALNEIDAKIETPELQSGGVETDPPETPPPGN